MLNAVQIRVWQLAAGLAALAAAPAAFFVMRGKEGALAAILLVLSAVLVVWPLPDDERRPAGEARGLQRQLRLRLPFGAGRGTSRLEELELRTEAQEQRLTSAARALEEILEIVESAGVANGRNGPQPVEPHATRRR